MLSLSLSWASQCFGRKSPDDLFYTRCIKGTRKRAAIEAYCGFISPLLTFLQIDLCRRLYSLSALLIAASGGGGDLMDEDMSPSSPDLSCGRAFAMAAGRRGSVFCLGWGLWEGGGFRRE